MDGLDGASLDSGSSAAALGSDPDSSSDATSPDAQASWGQAMADAGGDRSADGMGWDDTGSPWDSGAAAEASALSPDGASSQAAGPSDQSSTSDAQAAMASKDAYAVQASLDANPDDLLAQGWEETSHPKAAATGRRTFVNPGTGQSIEFDKGRSGEAGWRGQDHYHVPNPNSTGKRDIYLDKAGQPVSDGSKPSHIPPGK